MAQMNITWYISTKLNMDLKEFIMLYFCVICKYIYDYLTLPLTSGSLTPTYCVLCVCLRILMSYCVLCVCLRILMSTILLLLIFFVFYVLFFVLFVFVLCRMCLLLPISLDCPFLISISGFSNVYLAYQNSVSEWL